jgi:hypothetical protein
LQGAHVLIEPAGRMPFRGRGTSCPPSSVPLCAKWTRIQVAPNGTSLRRSSGLSKEPLHADVPRNEKLTVICWGAPSGAIGVFCAGEIGVFCAGETEGFGVVWAAAEATDTRSRIRTENIFISLHSTTRKLSLISFIPSLRSPRPLPANVDPRRCQYDAEF